MPVVRKSSVRAALAVVPMALAVVLGTPGLAHATEEDDSRARIVYDDNVGPGQKDACERAGLTGQLFQSDDQPGEMDVSGGEPNVDKYLTVHSVDGITVTGILVKGANAYNVYVPGERGLSDVPPWENLQSPLKENKNGHILPTISHWYACGVPTDKTTPSEKPTTSKSGVPTKSSESTPPETNSSTPTESTPGTPGTPDETSSSAPSSTSTVGGNVTTTTTPGAVVVENTSDSGDLASTGFGSSWLLGAGGLLVLAGAAVLVLLRIRRNA